MKTIIVLTLSVLSFFNALNSRAQFHINSTMRFEQNLGQIHGEDADKVRFLVKGFNSSVFLLDDGIAYQFNKMQESKDTNCDKDYNRKYSNLFSPPQTMETYRMDLRLVNANKNARISTFGKSHDFVNYYNYNVTNVHSYEKVVYHEIYPNIDWVIYMSEIGIKYDFVVRPGGNPDNIVFDARWVENLNLSPEGNLILENRLGQVQEQKPVSFQGGKKVATEFVIQQNTIHFDLGQYDSSEELIIDPSLVWSTYYGGSSGEAAWSTRVDSDGNVYIAGETGSTNNIASGGHQNTHTNLADAFLVKFNSSGVRQWATYYGGWMADRGMSCAVDNSGNVYLAGITGSETLISTAGSHQETFAEGTFDAFLVKFNSSGTRLWATYFGGSSQDVAFDCSTDMTGNVILVGRTLSGFGLISNGHQNMFGGTFDGFVAKFNASGTLQWSTYYGGEDEDEILSCSTDSDNNIYFAGRTASTNAIATTGAHQSTYGGGLYDAFLVKLSPSGTRLWSTYYGGSDWDNGESCSVDVDGNVYLAGGTISVNNVASGGAYQETNSGGLDAYLTKFSATGERQWATYLGGSGYDSAFGCDVDSNGNVFIAGWTESSSNIAVNGYQNTFSGGGGDAFVTKFNGSGELQWSSYFGGSGYDSAESCATDASGHIYVLGYTGSSGLGSNGHQNAKGGDDDAFLVKFLSEVDDVSIEDYKVFDFKIFPNPTSGELTLRFEDGNFRQIKIIGIDGVLVREYATNYAEEFIDLSSLEDGVYIVSVNYKNLVSSRKFVKAKY